MTKKQYGDEAERLAPSLRRIAYSVVRNEHDAQDAVQQALLSVFLSHAAVVWVAAIFVASLSPLVYSFVYAKRHGKI